MSLNKRRMSPTQPMTTEWTADKRLVQNKQTWPASWAAEQTARHESEDRRSPPKQQKAVYNWTPKTTSIKKRLYI